MILQIIIAIILGIILGIITGLIPGLHTNLVSSILVALLPFLLTLSNPLPLAIFICSMSITNLFLEFIPSIYLGAPDEETTLSILPGHELLLKGKGHQAIYYSTIGGALGLIISILIIPLMFFSLEKVYPFFEKMMAWLLIWISIFIVSENKQKVLATIIFILSGFLGIASLNLNINQSILPLLTGLFGISGLIFSINEKTKIPLQQTNIEKINKKELFKPIISGSIISPLCSFLPGLGSSQATVIGSKIFKTISREQFLILNGIINTILMILSFITLFLINKSRTGSANAISEILQLTKSNLTAIILTTILVGILSIFITLFLSKKVANIIEKINYTKLSYIIIIFLTILTILISGFLGLLVLIISTLLGLSCHYYGARKSILMGCLLIPTILYYLPF